MLESLKTTYLVLGGGVRGRISGTLSKELILDAELVDPTDALLVAVFFFLVAFIQSVTLSLALSG